MLKKRFTSLFLALAMVLGLSGQAFAANVDKESRLTSSVVKETLGSTALYTGTIDDIVFSIQVETNGDAILSYASADGMHILQSAPFKMPQDVLDTLDNAHKISFEKTRNFIASLDFSSMSMMDTMAINEPMVVASGSKTIEEEVLDTFKADYSNKFMSRKNMSWDKTYSFVCYGSQFTHMLKDFPFKFDEHTAVSAISAALVLKGFECSPDWFVGAAGMAIEVIDGLKYLAKAANGNAYYYKCNRVKAVKVPSYTNDVVYSTSEVLMHTFVRASSSATWQNEETHANTQDAYEDEQLMYSTALTRFVMNYLEA